MLVAWGEAPAAGDLLGLVSELVVAVLAALLLCRLGTPVCGLAAALWSLMCLVDAESLIALHAAADVGAAGFFFDRDFLRMTLSSAPLPYLLAAVAFLLGPPALLVVLLRRLDSRGRPAARHPVRAHLALAAVAAALIAALALLRSHDAGWRQTAFALVHVEQLIGTAVHSPAPDRVAAHGEDADALGHDLSGVPVAQGRARNVLLVVLEGIPGAHVPGIARYFGVDGEIRMTGLDAIAARSLVIPNFLTHQQQTIRGLYSALCGDYPRLGGGTPKAFEMLVAGDRGRDCLPAILAARGYRTAFIQAAPLEYMSKGTIMPAMGFEVVRGKESFRRGDEPFGGWGPRDRDFFEQSLPMLEELDAAKDPWFATLLTVGTHHPFVAPAREVEQHGSRKTAAVMAADSALTAFFAELVDRGIAEDTLVVVTSDESHGVPHHPHGNAWGVMLAHAPDIPPGFNPGVFGSVDTTISILDYLGVDPGDRVRGRSIFRTYERERTLLFTVGNDLAMTERKGVFHLCRPPGLGSLLSDSRSPDCGTVVTGSGEMFAPSYHHEPGADHAASYRRLLRLHGLLDSSVAGEGPSTRLVLARDVATSLTGPDDFWLLAGQFFTVPPGCSARVSMQVRFDADDGQVLRLQHHWVARDRPGGDPRELRCADFVVPAIRAGEAFSLAFDVGDFAGMSQVEAIVKGRSEFGVVTVGEYAVEFSDRRGPAAPAFKMVDARVRSSVFETRRLAVLNLGDGQRVVASIPPYVLGRTVRLTNAREHLDFTLTDGWWGPEEWVSWTRERARVYLDLGEVRGDHLLTVEMVSAPRSGSERRQVELHVNGRRVESWSVTGVASPVAQYRTVIPAGLLHPGVNMLELCPLGDLESPFSVDRSPDARKLGVGVRSLSLCEAENL